MTQSGLMDRIISAMGLKYITLRKVEHGEKCNGNFNNASMICMLLYIQRYYRLDLVFLVSQCVQYIFNQKLSHKNALKHIVGYLKGTRTKGLITRRSKTL